MQLNSIRPAAGAKKAKTRLGRGIGSGKGKTSGRGHKGQRARAGGYHKVGFEGGQSPMQRRLPKFGFVTQKSLCRAEVTLSDLNLVKGLEVTLFTLKEVGVITKNIKHAKIMLSGAVKKAVKVAGVGVTKGAREAICAAGGTVED